MITYMALKNDVLDFDDLEGYVMLPLLILVDVLFVLFQPILYLIYRYKKEEE